MESRPDIVGNEGVATGVPGLASVSWSAPGPAVPGCAGAARSTG